MCRFKKKSSSKFYLSVLLLVKLEAVALLEVFQSSYSEVISTSS